MAERAKRWARDTEEFVEDKAFAAFGASEMAIVLFVVTVAFGSFGLS